MNTDSHDFSHPELNLEVTAIGGSYFMMKEVRMPFEKEELLYFIGAAVFDTTCCGAGGAAYALVPGFIRKWKFKKDSNGRPVTRVTLISSSGTKQRIKKMIVKHESVHQVDFI
jgi:hypothetical protein